MTRDGELFEEGLTRESELNEQDSMKNWLAQLQHQKDQQHRKYRQRLENLLARQDELAYQFRDYERKVYTPSTSLVVQEESTTSYTLDFKMA